MFLSIHPDNPQPRLLDQAVKILRNGGVIIYPTDTMYALGCDINSKKAVHEICRIKGIDPNKAQLSCVCENLAITGLYVNRVSTPVFKLMKRALPGPYTFILDASREIPRHFQHKKTVGIRVVDHPITQHLVHRLGNPIASSTIPMEEEDLTSVKDPVLLYERWGKQVDLVIDGGYGNGVLSTVIDCSSAVDMITVLREGAGPLEPLGLDMGE
ncbi:MAG: L-threonylcarbamoyladenylate synthase [Bacteroidota bacterium]